MSDPQDFPFATETSAQRMAKIQADRQRKNRRTALFGLGCWTFTVLLAVLWVVSYVIWLPQTNRTVTATVTKTWVWCRSAHEDCKNLIGTDKGVFQDSDSLLYWKFNSSDYFNNMQVGKTYTFHVVGWRIPISSEWPNIVSCDDC